MCYDNFCRVGVVVASHKQTTSRHEDWEDKNSDQKSYGKKWFWAVVVVAKWSEYTPSTATILVQNQLKSTIFL